MEEGVCLVLETRRRVQEEKEDQQHARLKAEEKACLVKEARLKSEEGDLYLKAENKSCLVEDARLKAEQEEQAHLKAK